ncbi:MAG: TonB-dependent siderophore receptor [Sinorhizobium meliloti]|uniref:TonB-dependent siderophore receptor n=1 Tax=Rhizobium meliloti TaxID=382 RepID=UPI003F15B3DD|nr:TonB-dependent siderophore receptor [Sinorhizobium meliloti]
MKPNSDNAFNTLKRYKPHAWRTATALAAVLAVNGNAAAQEAVPGATQSGATQLDAIVVDGATKIPTTLVETPRSVSLISREELDKRAVQDIIEAVRYSAGVVTGSYGFDPRFEQITIRGNDITTTGDYRDGLRQPYLSYAMLRNEPYSLEQVEVIKGPISVLYGAGSPGGIVNKTSKMPTEETIREVGVLYGTENRIQGMFDFGGPLSENDDGLLYRVVGLARRGETNFDIADDRYLIQPALTWKPDEATSFTIYGLAQADETDVDVGAVIGPDGRIHDLRGSDPDYDFQKVRQQQIGYRFEHEFDNGLTFRQKLRYSHLKLSGRYLGITDWTGTVGHRTPYSLGDELDVFQVDNQLEYKFDTGPALHTGMLGLDYSNVKSAFGFGAGSSDPAYDFDIENPTWGVSGPTPAYSSLSDSRMRQLGVYVLDQIELDKWRFTLGGRQTWVQQDRDSTDVPSATTASESLDKHGFSVQLGTVYLFDNGLAPFANYATSFDPVTEKSRSGSILQPTEGEQFELGVKYQPPGTDILLSAALYHLVEKNKPIAVDPVNGIYESLGEVTNKGLELEARAHVADGLDLIAAYTYNNSEVTAGENVGNAPAVTPRHTASLWADYTFQEDTFASGLTVGAGLRFTGENYAEIENTSKNKANVYVDASLTYDFGALDKEFDGLTGNVAVRNIADRRDTVCNSGYCYLGQGRNITASLKYRW